MQWKHTNSPLPRKAKTTFHQQTLWLVFPGIKRESFTWTFSSVKKPSTHSIIQLSTEKVKTAVRSKQ
jgi:hypothetical protein